MKNIAFFISPHGFGHAARASGVMEALRAVDPSIQFEIFTTVPRVFFEGSLGPVFGYHRLETDVGLVQASPTREDIPGTLHALEKMYPFDIKKLADLAGVVTRLECELVVCDIAPMGIAVARLAGIPSVLVENFRWDWIYQNYLQFDQRIGKYIPYLEGVFNSADLLIQTEPVCVRHPAQLVTGPISRLPRTGRVETRRKLGLAPDDKVVYVSMGGTGWAPSFLKDLRSRDRYIFVISGSVTPPQRDGNLLFLDIRTYMPDVLAACDAVISKLGYSTLAEVYYAGLPFGYISRQHFEESRILEEFIQTEMQGEKITEAKFYSGEFVDRLDSILSLQRRPRQQDVTGAQAAARFILGKPAN